MHTNTGKVLRYVQGGCALLLGIVCYGFLPVVGLWGLKASYFRTALSLMQASGLVSALDADAGAFYTVLGVVLMVHILVTVAAGVLALLPMLDSRIGALVGAAAGALGVLISIILLAAVSGFLQYGFVINLLLNVALVGLGVVVLITATAARKYGRAATAETASVGIGQNQPAPPPMPGMGYGAPQQDYSVPVGAPAAAPAAPAAPPPAMPAAAPAAAPAMPAMAAQGAAPGSILCLSGMYRGIAFPIRDGENLNIGRDPARCNIVMVEHAATISRLHCTVHFDAARNCYTVVDHSMNGTWIGEKRCEREQVYTVPRGTTILLGTNRENSFCLN